MPTTPLPNTELPIQTGVTGLQLADAMFGDGIAVVSATYLGDTRSAGIYSDGNTVSPGVVPSADGIILSTGLAADFTNTTGASNEPGASNESGNTSTDTEGVDYDARMNQIAGVDTFDGAFLTTEFTSTGSELTMQLVFSSEEYLEWVKSGFNDAVGIWVNGVKAQLALGGGDISIDNINTSSNPNLFLNNADGTYNTEMDGATVVLTLKAQVNVGAVNTLVIGIADAGDAAYDSSLMIVANSVQSALVAHDDLLVLTSKGRGSIDLLANDTTAGRQGVHITELNGHKVVAGDRVVLGTGETLTLNADGTISVDATTQTNPVTFTYLITDSAGTTDTAYVTLTTSPVDGTGADDSMAAGYVDAQGNMVDGSDGLSEVIMGYAGKDKITAGFGDDDIYGGTGQDFIRAGDGNDLIYGGDGNDVLDGGTGADWMDGGAGNDVFYIDHSGDTILEASAAGYDKVISTLSHTLSANFEELWLKAGSLAQNAIGNAANNKIIGNQADNLIQGLTGHDFLWGEDGNDTVYGGAGNDEIYAGAGTDKVYGDDASDKLYGGTGMDSLYGGAGNDSLVADDDGDVLQGDAGRDLLTGAAGHDHFVFSTGSGSDTVKDFTLGQDQIMLVGVQTSAVVISHHGGSLWVQWGNADKVVIANIDRHLTVTTEMLGIGQDFDYFA